MVKIGVTPWLRPEEWNHVRELVLAGDKEAVDYFQVWSSRTSRLPVGVETTLALMQAKEDMSNTLALSMGINRFINHISHIGMNLHGVTKLHSAARLLSVPEWVVEVRNDATHGHMPSLYLIRSAFEFCWSWILVNYWKQKKSSLTISDRTVDRLPHLLDLFMYLRIYQIWGTNSLKNIASEEEIFGHIEGLWHKCIKQNGNNLLNYSVKQALDCVTSEISKLNSDPNFVAQVLVEHDLLVPQQEFVQSLSKEGAEEEDCVEVPRILLSVWKGFIEAIDAKIGARFLIDRLVDKIVREDVDESNCEYCSAWVVEISESLLGHSDKLKLNKDHGCTIANLETWLRHPNRLIQMLLPCFCSLSGVTGKQVSSISKLLAASIGEMDIKLNKEKLEKDRVFTLQDLEGFTENCENETNDDHVPREEESLQEQSEYHKGNPKFGWKRQHSNKWSKGKLFKLGPSQSWDSLWLTSACKWEGEEQEENSSTCPTQDLNSAGQDNPLLTDMTASSLVTWPGQGGGGGQKRGSEVQDDQQQVPAFYRIDNTHLLARHHTPRRKKQRKRL